MAERKQLEPKIKSMQHTDGTEIPAEDYQRYKDMVTELWNTRDDSDDNGDVILEDVMWDDVKSIIWVVKYDVE